MMSVFLWSKAVSNGICISDFDSMAITTEIHFASLKFRGLIRSDSPAGIPVHNIRCFSGWITYC